MKIKNLLYTLLLLYCGAARGQAPPEPVLSPEQLQADFAHFQTALREAHPAMYRYTPKATFDSLFATTRTHLNRPMSRHEFYVAMTPLLVALRDGHIKWIVPGQDQHYPFFQDRLFPLKLYFVENRAWVVANYGKLPVPEGAEIITINDQPMAGIVNRLLPTITFADGATLNGKYHDLNHYFPGYYATYIEAPREFRITFESGGSQKTVSLPAVTYQDIQAFTQAPAQNAEAFRLTIDDSTHTAFLTIRRFWTEKNEKSFDDFLALTFAQIKSRKCNNLVLDLRDNEGGEEKYGIALYRYLARQPFRYYDHISVAQKKALSFPAYTPRLYRMLRWLVVKKQNDGYVFTAQRGLKIQKPERDAFLGKLYVLINGASFSVTTELAARVQADGRGTFLGQETGGAYEGNNSGIFAITQLPHSKIDLGVPMFGFYMADLPDKLDKGQGIRPDRVVVPTVENILTGHDPVMHTVKQMIRSADSATETATPPLRTSSPN